MTPEEQAELIMLRSNPITEKELAHEIRSAVLAELRNPLKCGYGHKLQDCNYKCKNCGCGLSRCVFIERQGKCPNGCAEPVAPSDCGGCNIERIRSSRAVAWKLTLMSNRALTDLPTNLSRGAVITWLRREADAVEERRGLCEECGAMEYGNAYCKACHLVWKKDWGHDPDGTCPVCKE